MGRALFKVLVLFAVGLIVSNCMVVTQKEQNSVEIPAADFYVSPQGNDSWSGQLAFPKPDGTDGPFATINRAKEAVRLKLKELNQAKASKNASAEAPEERKVTQSVTIDIIQILIRGGRYELTEPLIFTPEDSGNDALQVRYSAYPREVPVISGGKKITGMQVTKENYWQVTIPEVKEGKWNFSQLFVNNQRRYRPRLPEEGYYRILKDVPPTEKAKGKGYDCFCFNKGEIDRNWQNTEDVEVLVFHNWNASRMKIAEIDEKNNVVTFTKWTCSPSAWAGLVANLKYLVINVKEGLKKPGQWYLDRKTGILTYIPFKGESLNQCEIVAPKIDQILILQGLPDKEYVQNIHFKGLVFEHTNWNLPPEGLSISQAEVSMSAAVYALA
ncbi:MAG: hypothetical protein ABIH42_07485, partial [Planctomycetota bacterium]